MTNLFSSRQYVQCVFNFFFHPLISFNLLLMIAAKTFFLPSKRAHSFQAYFWGGFFSLDFLVLGFS